MKEWQIPKKLYKNYYIYIYIYIYVYVYTHIHEVYIYIYIYIYSKKYRQCCIPQFCSKYIALRWKQVAWSVVFVKSYLDMQYFENLIFDVLLYPPGIKMPGFEINHWYTSITAIKNMWSCISIPLYTLVNKYAQELSVSLKKKGIFAINTPS
jgi:hypothetical protein